MKKLLFILFLLFTSCISPIKKVQNPEKYTTVEMIQKAKDTVVVYIDNDIIYVLKDNKLLYKVQNIDTDKKSPISDPLLFLLVVSAIILIIIILVYLTSSLIK